MKQETVVIFRKWADDDSVIALFPYELATATAYFCDSYEHLGGHGPADPGLIARTRPASPEEYAPVKAELDSKPYGYILKVRKRMPSDALAVREKKIAEAR